MIRMTWEVTYRSIVGIFNILIGMIVIRMVIGVICLKIVVQAVILIPGFGTFLMINGMERITDMVSLGFVYR